MSERQPDGQMDGQMDAASLYDNAVDEALFAGNYQAVVKSNLFIEGQYSQRTMETTGTGSRFTDLLRGTPIWDRSRSQARFNAPTFCAVCPNAVDRRNNVDGYAKASSRSDSASARSREGASTSALQGFRSPSETSSRKACTDSALGSRTRKL